MTVKRVIIVILVLLMVFALTANEATGDRPDSASAPDSGSASGSDSASDSSPAPDPAPDQASDRDRLRVLTGPIPEARNIEAAPCADPAKAEAAKDIIGECVSRFPPGFPERAGIDAVYLCEGLKSIGVPSPAASARIDGRTAVFVDAGSPRRIDVSFTHELFHAVEFKYPVDEEEWARINPYETYLRDEASPGDIVRYVPNMTPAFEPGFVSDYARFSGMEDRAELFSALYSGRKPGARERTAMLSDPFLMEKISFLKNHLDKAGLDTKGMRDNLFPGESGGSEEFGKAGESGGSEEFGESGESGETRCFCRAFTLTDPGLARKGPSDAYPGANLKAGELLADSGFEKNGIKMLYDSGFARVYAPLSALEPLDGETVEIVVSGEPGNPATLSASRR